MTSSIWLVDNPHRTVTSGDPLTGPRTEAWRWELLDLDGAPMGDLDGATTGQLEFIGNTASGTLRYAGKDQPDWLTSLIRPWYRADFPGGDHLEWPGGVYLPVAPDTDHDDGRIDVGVELQSLLTILDEDEVDKTYSLPIGTVVTSAVRALITSSGGIGGGQVAGTDSTETLRAGRLWEPGTSKLQIINELLAAINYRPLRADNLGTYRLDPQIPPAGRATVWDFEDGPASIYLPRFKRSRDYRKVPNKVTCVASGSGETFAITATAENNDVDDPLSIPCRKRVISVTERVEATSMTVLQQIADRRLAELSQVSSTVEFEHALVPLAPEDIVRFRRNSAGLQMRAAVESMAVTCEPGALVKSKIREVAV